MKYEQLIQGIKNLQEGYYLLQDVGDSNVEVLLRALMTSLNDIPGEFTVEVADGILRVTRNNHQKAA